MAYDWSRRPVLRRVSSCYNIGYVHPRNKNIYYTSVYNMAQMANAVMSLLDGGFGILSIRKDDVFGRRRAAKDFGDAYEDAYRETHGGYLPY